MRYNFNIGSENRHSLYYFYEKLKEEGHTNLGNGSLFLGV